MLFLLHDLGRIVTLRFFKLVLSNGKQATIFLLSEVRTQPEKHSETKPEINGINNSTNINNIAINGNLSHSNKDEEEAQAVSGKNEPILHYKCYFIEYNHYQRRAALNIVVDDPQNRLLHNLATNICYGKHPHG